jgi:hypothetical protein
VRFNIFERKEFPTICGHSPDQRRQPMPLFSSCAPGAAMNGRMFGARPMTMIAQVGSAAHVAL